MSEHKNEFNEVIKNLLESYGFQFEPQIEDSYCQAIDKHGKSNYPIHYLIAIKLYKQKEISIGTIRDILKELKQKPPTDISTLNRMFIVGNVIPDEVWLQINKEGLAKGIEIVDISNLLYLCNAMTSLKNDLLRLLDYSVEDISLQSKDIFEDGSQGIGGADNSNYLKRELLEWEYSQNNQENAKAYERLCFDVLKYLFIDELGLWRYQNKSNDGLYIFDLVCSIKHDVKPELWNVFQTFLNTKYIVFDFKNYKKKITQVEVYTTERYLYTKALRAVGFIISNLGPDDHSQKAAKGAFRESGKLILLLSNNDLIKMIEMKQQNGVPSDYIFENIFEPLMIELEK